MTRFLIIKKKIHYSYINIKNIINQNYFLNLNLHASCALYQTNKVLHVFPLSIKKRINKLLGKGHLKHKRITPLFSLVLQRRLAHCLPTFPRSVNFDLFTLSSLTKTGH